MGWSVESLEANDPLIRQHPGKWLGEAGRLLPSHLTAALYCTDSLQPQETDNIINNVLCKCEFYSLPIKKH